MHHPSGSLNPHLASIPAKNREIDFGGRLTSGLGWPCPDKLKFWKAGAGKKVTAAGNVAPEPGANCLCQSPGFAPQVPGFWRAPEQIKDLTDGI